MVAIHRAVAAHLPALATSGLGGCCSPEVAKQHGGVCLRVWVGLCGLAMSELVGWVNEELEASRLGDARIGVDVSVSGPVGPRCTPSDPDCGPLDGRQTGSTPIRSEAGCVTGRAPLPDRPDPDAGGRRSGGACGQDGDCVVAGCGPNCVPWNESDRLPSWCDDVERTDRAPEYCGCVERRCTWFRPSSDSRGHR